MLHTNFQADYCGESIELPFNWKIMEWAHKTKRVFHSAKLPSKVTLYIIYGTSLETPHSVCYGNEKMPVKDLRNLRYFQVTT
ncbi:unnamed protein product [Eruca vesicaria subsp. sativa]|uniref:Uncharacterized protein n=1 Tax=Eruca vesicaria subsp. sativa TaxID=29727 RepID=A0ABC8K7C2_ERUVS|nr:unnamed protein product [Eruca vesicaria subsp. sativa]